MLNISYNINMLKHVFVILCSFCGDRLRYQNIRVKYLFEQKQLDCSSLECK